MEEIFEGLGFKDSERKVYLALLELGKAKSGQIIEKSKLHPSVVFLAINNLADKGLIAKVKVTKHNMYTAAHPDVLIELLESRKQQVQNILPELKARMRPTVSEGAEMFEGIKGIKALFSTIIADGQENDVFYYFDAEEHEHRERAQNVYTSFHTKAKQKGIILKGIQRIDSQTIDEYKETVNIRLVDMAIPPDTSIFRDKIAFISWTDTPKGFLITSQQLANQYLELWKEIWENAKPA